MTIKQTIGVFAVAVILNACNNNHNNNGSYQEQVQSVEEIERSQPTNFLNASGTYNQTLFGNNIKVHGVIKNSATVANFKDVVVKVTYYSKTQTVIGRNNYIIYDFFPPHSEKTFELKIDKIDGTNTIGWDVVKATPN